MIKEQDVHVKSIKEYITMALNSSEKPLDASKDEYDTHVQNIIVAFVDEIKHRYRYKNLSESFFNDVCRAAALYDIGKVQTPDSILKKPGKLTPQEFEIMKQHTVKGAELLDKATENFEDKQLVKIAHNIIKSHHERWDGKGYPSGLRDESIPLEARMVAIADVYDALISERSYKHALSKEDAIKVIQKGQGTQFDPHLVNIFLDIIKNV